MTRPTRFDWSPAGKPPRHAAPRQALAPTPPQFSTCPATATKPQSKEKAAGSAGSDADGWPCSTTQNFGAQKFAPQIASTHQPPAPSFRTPTNAPNYSLLSIPNKKSSPQSKPP